MKPNNLRTVMLAVAAAMAMPHRSLAAVDPNFYVFLAFGQSNMEGQAPPESQDLVANARFKNLSAVTCNGRTQGQWIPAVAPIVRCDTYLGPLDWFGRTLADSLPSNITIGVVPVAVAGTAIRGFVSSAAASYYASQPSWMQSIASQYGNNPYARLVAMAKVAQQTGVIKGILLHQGETDAYNSGWRDTVKTIYTSLLTDLGLTTADVPLLAGEVAPTGSSSGANSTIDALNQTIPTAYVIKATGLTIGTYSNNQNVHFSAASYRTLGARYAQQMLKLLPKASTTLEPLSRPILSGMRVESSAQGIAIHSEVALERVSLVSVQGHEVVLGSGNDLRILTGQFSPGVYFLRALSGGASESHKVLVEH